MVLCYTNYYLIHITFYYTLHISFYIYMFICFYTYIFIFFYGFLTVDSTVPSYGFLFSTVASLTVGSVRFPLRLSIRFPIRLSLYSFLFYCSPHTLLSYLYTPHIHPLYSEYYLLLYPLLCSSLRFFLPRFFSHIFHSV